MLSLDTIAPFRTINPIVGCSWLRLALELEIDQNIRAVHLDQGSVTSALLFVVVVSKSAVQVLNDGSGVDVLTTCGKNKCRMHDVIFFD